MRRGTPGKASASRFRSPHCGAATASLTPSMLSDIRAALHPVADEGRTSALDARAGFRHRTGTTVVPDRRRRLVARAPGAHTFASFSVTHRTVPCCQPLTAPTWNPRATHGNTLVMRRSLDGDKHQGGGNIGMTQPAVDGCNVPDTEGLAASIVLIAILLGVLLVVGGLVTCSRNACRSGRQSR